MRSSVLPEPAGACTMKEASGSSARSRSRRSGALCIVGALRARHADRQPLAHAAERVLVAQLAGCGAFPRCNAGIALGIAGPDRLERHAPLRQEIVPVPIAPGEAR